MGVEDSKRKNNQNAGINTHQADLSGKYVAGGTINVNNQYQVAETNTTNLEDIIGKLKLNAPLIEDIHRLNCDRKKLTNQFDSLFEELQSESFQFYIIAAKASHQPNYFAARLILLLDEDFDSKNNLDQAIYFRRDSRGHGIFEINVDTSRRNKIYQKFCQGFTLGVNAEFEKQILYEHLSSFVESNAYSLKYKHLALLFNFRVEDSHFPYSKLIEQIHDSFLDIDDAESKFLFFFTFTIDENISKTQYKKFIKKIKQNLGKFSNTRLLDQFSNVPKNDVIHWLQNAAKLTFFEAQKVTEYFIRELDTDIDVTSQVYDKESEEFQMSFIQSKLNEICEYYKRNY